MTASAGETADLLERVRAGGLLEPGRDVLVLLSGGRDSVCLLDLAVRIAGAGHVAALHCNYGLRADAGADEAHCAALCERLGVALHVRRPRRSQAEPCRGTQPAAPAGAGTQPAAPAGTGNLQAWARDQRYAEASRIATERGGDV